MKKIPVAQPILGEQERSYLLDALDAGAISGFFGDYLGRFERNFADYCGSTHGVTVSSGTTALHLALAAVGIKPGDEVLVATMTNMASFFAVHYLGAVPIPVDIEADTLNLDPALLENLITSRTRAILVVHLFGHPADMDPILDVAKRHGLAVIEDCAQAHGAEYHGRKVGSLGTIGCFSFYANKVITTGEGGMCITNDAVLAEKMRSLKSLAFGTDNKFMHSGIGYNYRMTNLQAAIGCAQLEKIEDILVRKRQVAADYTGLLADCAEVQLPVEKSYARNVFWMYHIVLKGKAADARPAIMARLAAEGIETRETFIPYNLQEHLPLAAQIRRASCPRANEVALRGFYLPSGPVLDKREIALVVDRLQAAIAAC